MDNPAVSEPREAPPAWAHTQRDDGVTGEPTASQPQLNYIRDLSTQKDLTRLRPEQRAALLQPEEFWDEKTTRLSKAKATTILNILTDIKICPYKPKDAQLPTTHMAERFALEVPAGRYAVEAENGELRFYKVWVSRDKKRLNVYVEHGPAESDLKYQKTILTILNKIKTVGIRKAAIRYGMEIGACSNCGLRLTNRISRELGIGPVCGGRMFGDDFKLEVKAKRAEIKARGEDPNELFEVES